MLGVVKTDGFDGRWWATTVRRCGGWREKMEVYGERGFGEDEGGSRMMNKRWRKGNL